MLPNVNVSDIEGRSRRSLLPFVGSIFSTLFGVSTQDEVRQLAAHVKGVSDNVVKMSSDFQVYSEHMSSFVSSTNKRIDNVLEAVKFQQADFMNFVNASSKTYHILTEFSMRINKILHHFHSWTVEMDNLLNAVELLALGKLPSYLVPSSVLGQTISSIQTELNNRFHPFTLGHSSPAYYYTQAKVIAVRSAAHVYITVRFPITTRPLLFNEYVTKIVPVPMHNDSTHVSEIVGLPQQVFYFG